VQKRKKVKNLRDGRTKRIKLLIPRAINFARGGSINRKKTTPGREEKSKIGKEETEYRVLSGCWLRRGEEGSGGREPEGRWGVAQRQRREG